MNLLNSIKNIRTEACVSIIMNTHLTKPENQKDEIKLKNFVKETENRLLGKYDKKFVKTTMDNLNKVVHTIDHNYNSNSLIVYANADFAEFTQLPIEVKDRIIIDQTFATRDLIRAMQSESSYYVLVLSRQQARLIKAHGNNVVKEIKKEFPLVNTLYTTDKAKLTTAKQDSLIEEFFNRVDKSVLKTISVRNLPILLATEARNFSHYQKVADQKGFIIGFINGNKDDDTANKIVSDAWEKMLPMIKEKNAARFAELKKAVSNGKFYSDLNEIWNAIIQGKGKTLFVKRDFMQSAILEENHITLTDISNQNQKNYVDDIIDEMIEQTMFYGGDIVFIDGDELKKFNNVALLLRY